VLAFIASSSSSCLQHHNDLINKYVHDVTRQPGQHLTQAQLMSSSQSKEKLECGPMPNVVPTLPITGGALCSTPQSLADAQDQSVVQ